MPAFTTTQVEDTGTGLAERAERALGEKMTTLPLGGDIYSVTTQSGREYHVDARTGRCTCPDHAYREVECKHLLRYEFATGVRPIPVGAEVDELLGEHVDGHPRLAATDGGVLEAGSDEQAERPDDCRCWDADQHTPCWPCYREGFETPNPDPGDDGDQDETGKGL